MASDRTAMTNDTRACEFFKHYHIPFKGQVCLKCEQVHALRALLDAFERERRDKCFKDMYRFIENCRKDSTPDVPAYEMLTVMLQTLNDCGSGGFGDSDWQKPAAQPTPEVKK